MAIDNPSYFTIPGGLSSNAGAAAAKGTRFFKLKRQIRMGNNASQLPDRAMQPSQYHTLPSSSSESRQKDERYSNPPSTTSAAHPRPTRSLSQTITSPLHTQMLVLGMPRPSDIAPSSTYRLRQSSMRQPYRSSTDLFSTYYNQGGTPPSRRHSIGAYFPGKSSAPSQVKSKGGILEEDSGQADSSAGEESTVNHYGTAKRGNRAPGMEDIIIISSQRSQAAELWVTYLKTCFEQIRKNRKKPPFRILCISVEDIEDSTPMTTVVETKLRQARLEIVILCPVFLDYVLQHPERMSRLAALLQPSNVLTMLLGVEEKTITEQHRAALVSYSQWRKMESVRDRDEKFVSDFLGAAMEILGRTPTNLPVSSEKCHFMLVPKKVNQAQKKVVIILNEPIDKDDVIRVSIMRNGEDVEVSGIKKCNPFTLVFRVPDVYLGATTLVTIRVTQNGRDLGGKQLKCESQLHALEQLLRGCDNPMEFTCQALNIVPTDKSKLDELFIKAFQRNVPPNFNLLHTAGLAQTQRGAVSREEYPTLLHFAARFGLEQLSWALLECPGGDIACDLRNGKELTPADMADAAGHSRLSNVLSGYMQMNQFSSAYALLKGMVDGKSEDHVPADEYLNPRPLNETYQIPPTPRPCPPPETPPPPIGYMPMVRLSHRSTDSSSSDRNSDSISHSRERLLCRSRLNSAEQESRQRDGGGGGNGIEEELIEIISDFKNNVLTISEVESLVEQWRRRNDVQQSFREKQEHLNKLREEYERVQQRMKDEMKDVGRSSPMERIRNFFRGKPKNKAGKKRLKQEENLGNRPASSLSILSSSSSSSGRLSTASGGSLCDSSIHSEVDSERRGQRAPNAFDSSIMDNYDIPPSPISYKPDNQLQDRARINNYDVPPSPIELAAACLGAEYCNIPQLPNESSLYGKVNKVPLNTVREENKTEMMYINLPETTILGGAADIDCHNLPDYVNVETQGIELSVK